MAIGEAVFRRRSAVLTATVIIGANLPDVDVAAYAVSSPAALAFRRGWTHGLLAMAVWPLLLAGLMALFRRGQGPDQRTMLLASALAIWSHPLLDFLNTYGVRFLMPFSGRWFYGDTLFIIDPWVWLALLTGVLASRRWPAAPARAALGAVLAYVTAMSLWTGVKEREARSSAPGDAGVDPRSVMAAPVFARPLAREVLLETDSFYITAGERIAKPSGETLRRAAGTVDGRRFLAWSRFPYLRACDGICLADARYPGQDWAEARITAAR